MFNFNKKPQEVALDKAISDLLEELESMEGSNPDYAETSDQLVKLMKLKKDVAPSWIPSPDALIGVAGSLLSVALILHYEKIDVVTSKALAFVGKMK